MSNLRKIYLISGPLGAGKSTIAKKVADQTNTILIEGDLLLHSLDDNLAWGEKLKTTWKKILTLTKDAITNNFDVVIDFVVEDELEWFYRQTSDLNIQIRYIVLFANEKVLKQRLEKRNDLKYLLNQLKGEERNIKYLCDSSQKEISEIVEKFLSNSDFIVRFVK